MGSKHAPERERTRKSKNRSSISVTPEASPKVGVCSTNSLLPLLPPLLTLYFLCFLYLLSTSSSTSLSCRVVTCCKNSAYRQQRRRNRRRSFPIEQPVAASGKHGHGHDPSWATSTEGAVHLTVQIVSAKCWPCSRTTCMRGGRARSGS